MFSRKLRPLAFGKLGPENDLIVTWNDGPRRHMKSGFFQKNLKIWLFIFLLSFFFPFFSATKQNWARRMGLKMFFNLGRWWDDGDEYEKPSLVMIIIMWGGWGWRRRREMNGGLGISLKSLRRKGNNGEWGNDWGSERLWLTTRGKRICQATIGQHSSSLPFSPLLFLFLSFLFFSQYPFFFHHAPPSFVESVVKKPKLSPLCYFRD